MPLIRAELHRPGRRQLGRERKNHTVQSLSVAETTGVLGVAPNTVIRDWHFARAWLRRELNGTN
jgi:hypothetical protein